MHTQPVTPLQKLVSERLADQNLSYRGAANRAGGLLSHSSLNFIAHGQMRAEALQPRTIRGLALALDLPVSEVEKTVKESSGVTTVEFRLPKKADKLTPAQRKAVLAFVNALLEDK
jgi:hypothetical protein